MKKLVFCLLIVVPSMVVGQIGEKFEPGFIIDKFGARYDGFLRLEPGDNKKPSELIFKETRKSKKDVYGPDYVTAFKIEKDSFIVVNNVPLPNKKSIKADFVKVVLTGPGGVLYFREFLKKKSTGHAAADYKVEEENSGYLALVNGKLVMLSPSNYRDLAIIVSDFQDLKLRIEKRKIKYADIPKVVEEYQAFKEQNPSQK
jgi:hypothetical protein